MGHHGVSQPTRRISAIRRMGWRLGAVPVLAALTVGVLAHSGSPAAAHIERGTGGSSALGDRTAPGGRDALSRPVTVHTTADDVMCARNHERRYVVVSIADQHAWMCDGARQVFSSPVTTGAVAKGRRTPRGTWTVQGRERNRFLVGPGYRDYVKYWVPFNGDYGFHDATWQTMPFGAPGYRVHGSHGCVHLPMPAMKWVYHWATVGQTVVTVR